MCNLYSQTKGPQAIRDLARATRDLTGNLEPLARIYPDAAAPIVRVASDGVRELALARWGLPSPAFALEGKKTDRGITNVRNTASPHWRRWLGVEHRCLVPFSSFSEFNKAHGGDVWFELAQETGPGFFAGVWVGGWTSVRKLKEGAVSADLYAFLTCAPNAEVRAVHPKAMPVILTQADEIETWLTAPWREASLLQRPLADGMLRKARGG